MSIVRFTGRAVAVGLALTATAAAAWAQTDTTRARTDTLRRDSTTMRDTTVRDTTMRDTTMRDTTRMMRDTTRMMTDTARTMRESRGVVDPNNVRSTRRIPVQKDRGFSTSTGTYDERTGLRTRTSAGDVMLDAERARIDSLYSAAAADRQRLDSVEARTTELNTTVAGIRDSVNAVRTDVNAVRTELTAISARQNAIADSVRRVSQSLYNLRNGSLFNHSGFFVGVGAGANFTSGTFNDLGYGEGLNIAVPFGWHRLGQAIGFRGELGYQTFEGRANVPFSNGGTTSFSNPDPKVFSAVAMLSLALPINQARTNNFYIMGGGGAYMFRDIGANSTLRDRLTADANDGTSPESETNLGVTAGVGAEFRILGPANFFVQSRYTHLFTEEGTTTSSIGGSSLRWIPLIAGITLR